MELAELKSTWQAYENKLERSLKLNLHCLEMIQAQKVRSKLTSLLWLRVFELVIHIAAILWLIDFLYTNFLQIQFAIPAIILIAFFVICFINCLKQIIVIKQMDYSNDIVTIQSSLVMLQAHIVDYVRLSFLCIPTYLAYPIIAFKAFGNFDIVSKMAGNSWWNWQIIFSVALVPICIWLYKHVSYKNMHKEWVRFIIKNTASPSVTKAMLFINELDTLKKETV